MIELYWTVSFTMYVTTTYCSWTSYNVSLLHRPVGLTTCPQKSPFATQLCHVIGQTGTFLASILVDYPINKRWFKFLDIPQNLLKWKYCPVRLFTVLCLLWGILWLILVHTIRINSGDRYLYFIILYQVFVFILTWNNIKCNNIKCTSSHRP